MIRPVETIPVKMASSTILNRSPSERNKLSTLPIMSFGIWSIKKEFLATLTPQFPMEIKNISDK